MDERKAQMVADSVNYRKVAEEVATDAGQQLVEMERQIAEYRRALEFISKLAVMGPYIKERFEAMGQIALDALHGLPPEGSPYET